MEHTYGESVADFSAGDRVELYPSIDWWIQGARFGTVLRGRDRLWVKVKLDKLPGAKYVAPRFLRRIEGDGL